MKEFEGIENCDSNIRAAIVNFGYNLCLGDLDLAFNFIANIKRYIIFIFYYTNNLYFLHNNVKHVFIL